MDVPEEPESPPEELLEVPPSKRRPSWYRETIQEAEKHKARLGTFRESIRPHKYLGLMSQLISTEPSTYKEATSQHVWIDAMSEEYSSIIKNNVWNIQMALQIKHAADGSVEKYKARFLAWASLKRKT